MNVKGLKINTILNMDWNDINKLSRTDLSQLTSRVVSVANKRIKRLEKTRLGKMSFAYQQYEKQGRKFSVRGKNTGQLKNELANAMRFVRYKTSSVKGWTEYRVNMEERISGATDGESNDWSTRTWKKFWKVYRRFEESHGGTFKKGDSARFQEFIHDVFQQNDKRRSADYFQQRINNAYEKQLYEESMKNNIPNETNGIDIPNDEDEDEEDEF